MNEIHAVGGWGPNCYVSLSFITLPELHAAQSILVYQNSGLRRMATWKVGCKRLYADRCK